MDIEVMDILIEDNLNAEIGLYGISDATVSNWKKLNTNAKDRLTTRANKRKSKRRIIPVEYISNKGNISVVQDILDYIDRENIDIMDAIYSLGIGLLKKAGIYDNDNVVKTLSKYKERKADSVLESFLLPEDEFDILGLIYQSYLQEGKKNIIGSYYTPQKIVINMTKNFDFSDGQTFLDPCCGSGAFLLSAPVKDPCQLFGVDNDRVAVMIAEINMLRRFKNIDFVPQIYCLDYLMGNSMMQQHLIFEKKFDYIATNPPWGAMDSNVDDISEVTSKESFSYFFVKAHSQLKESGRIRFLFPESILNVKVHKDIRKFMIETAKLVGITIYDEMFSGVTTKYVDIECCSSAKKDSFLVYSSNKERTVNIDTVYETESLVLNLLSDDDAIIINRIKEKGRYTLKNSIWALGIVTGDNKNKLSKECLSGMEKIYTGKEIQPYVLQSARNYVVYDRNKFQQVAKEDIYRSPEKLVYKFISNKLVFAYDDKASLFLNSANILIPSIPSMSIKTVMAFLNSTLYQYLYMKLFGEVKVLKGNLSELPFPGISKEENDILISLVDRVLGGDSSVIGVIDDYIFSIYSLTKDQVAYVRSVVDGKAD